jgi:hypothetical protein
MQESGEIRRRHFPVKSMKLFLVPSLSRSLAFFGGGSSLFLALAPSLSRSRVLVGAGLRAAAAAALGAMLLGEMR